MRAHRLALALAAAVVCLLGSAVADGSLDPGLDGTLNHVEYVAAGQPPDRQTSSSSSSAAAPSGSGSSAGEAKAFSAEHAARRAELLASMAPPVDGSRVDFQEEHPRFRVLRAMYGFARHQARYQADLAGWEDGYKAIPERHREVRLPPSSSTTRATLPERRG
jgi:hypothetical protein